MLLVGVKDPRKKNISKAQKDANLRHNIKSILKVITQLFIAVFHPSSLSAFCSSIINSLSTKTTPRYSNKSQIHETWEKRGRTRQPERSHCACRWLVSDTRQNSLENFLHLITEEGRKFLATSRWLSLLFGKFTITWTLVEFTFPFSFEWPSLLKILWKINRWAFPPKLRIQTNIDKVEPTSLTFSIFITETLRIINHLPEINHRCYPKIMMKRVEINSDASSGEKVTNKRMLKNLRSKKLPS